MSSKLNIEELKTLIANSIREENLHESLPEDAIERIKNKILAVRDREGAKEIPDIVSEEIASPEVTPFNSFPDEDQIEDSPAQQEIDVDVAPINFMDAGAVQVGQHIEPKMGYVPELPEILKKSEPAELFVFQHNELGANGENLSNKPMRLMDDPDVMKSMNDLWVQEGKTRAKIYAAKFEEIGEIEFDYATGVSKFTDKVTAAEYDNGSNFKDNPYAETAMPQIDDMAKKELETYIKSSVDLEKVVHDIVMSIVKDSLLTNSEKSINTSEYVNEPAKLSNTEIPAVNYVQESLEFKLTMKDIVECDEYQKIVIPEKLNESILSGDKTMLVCENNELQKWSFNNLDYYIPIGRISQNKGYTKY